MSQRRFDKPSKNETSSAHTSLLNLYQESRRNNKRRPSRRSSSSFAARGLEWECSFGGLPDTNPRERTSTNFAPLSKAPNKMQRFKEAARSPEPCTMLI